MKSNENAGRNGNDRSPAGTTDEALEIARAAIHRGELERGRQALSWVLKQEPRNSAAWFWMACCVTDEGAKADCYRRASH